MTRFASSPDFASSSIASIEPSPRTSPIAACREASSSSRPRTSRPISSARSRNDGAASASSTAPAAAHETGFPLKVPPRPPGSTESISSAFPVTAASGSPPPRVFPETSRSGSTSKCEIAQTGPVRPHPDCTSSAT